MDALGVKRPTADPHATAYIDRMVELIGAFGRLGVAYETSDGVYLEAGRIAGLRAAGPPVDREPSGGRPRRGQRREAFADRLRPLEEGQTGRALVGVTVG